MPMSRKSRSEVPDGNGYAAIRSRENETFKRIKKLLGSPKERRKRKSAVLEGRRLVEVYLRRVGPPAQLVLSAAAGRDERHGKVVALSKGTPVTVLSDALFKDISTLNTPTGIFAVIPLPVRQRTGRKGDCLFLDGLQDPGNLGMILRSAAAAGVETVSLSRACADAWSPKVLRAGMGAHFLMDIVEEEDLAGSVESFDGTVLVLDPAVGKSIFETDLQGRTGFVIGSEGGGVSPALLRAADTAVAIPMPGWEEPLNAAAAATVCLFEMVRQRRRGEEGVAGEG
jgi:TrmH family RNA methyltransferase